MGSKQISRTVYDDVEKRKGTILALCCATCDKEPEWDDIAQAFDELPIETKAGAFCSNACRKAAIVKALPEGDIKELHTFCTALMLLEYLQYIQPYMEPFMECATIRDDGSPEAFKRRVHIDLGEFGEIVTRFREQLDLV